MTLAEVEKVFAITLHTTCLSGTKKRKDKMNTGNGSKLSRNEREKTKAKWEKEERRIKRGKKPYLKRNKSWKCKVDKKKHKKIEGGQWYLDYALLLARLVPIGVSYTLQATLDFVLTK